MAYFFFYKCKDNRHGCTYYYSKLPYKNDSPRAASRCRRESGDGILSERTASLLLPFETERREGFVALVNGIATTALEPEDTLLIRCMSTAESMAGLLLLRRSSSFDLLRWLRRDGDLTPFVFDWGPLLEAPPERFRSSTF